LVSTGWLLNNEKQRNKNLEKKYIVVMFTLLGWKHIKNLYKEHIQHEIYSIRNKFLERVVWVRSGFDGFEMMRIMKMKINIHLL